MFKIYLKTSLVALSIIMSLGMPSYTFAFGNPSTPPPSTQPIIEIPSIPPTVEEPSNPDYKQDQEKYDKALSAKKAIHADRALSATFVSADNDNVVFVVNLDKESYTNKENVTFSFYFEDVDTGKKPEEGSVQVKVGSGSYVEIISKSSSATSYNISLPPILSGGQHILTFKIPNLCGSAFSFSIFGFSIFGKDDCEFSKTVEVTTNTPPTLPTQAGSCTVGSNNQYIFSSSDPGDTLYYEIDFNRNGVDVRVPVSGLMSPAPLVGYANYDGWDTQGLKLLRARATDSEGETLGWKNYSVMCTPVCTNPVVCDGGSAGLTFFAQPALVIPGSVTTLHWSLKNVLTCSITGTNVDVWGWDIVGSVQEQGTVEIEETVTYTLSCTDFDGVNTSTTTKVHIVPQWQEF